MMKTVFLVQGPYAIPFYQGKAARIINEENIKEFWKKNPGLSKQRGCYVFGIRAAKGLTPGYVGKASQSFKQEVFSYHKLTRYQEFMADYRRGTPIIFFLVAPSKKGAPNVSRIGELEDFLLQVAMSANPDLLNVRGTKTEEWGIAGVLRGGQGKPNAAAKEFQRLMKI